MKKLITCAPLLTLLLAASPPSGTVTNIVVEANDGLTAHSIAMNGVLPASFPPGTLSGVTDPDCPSASLTITVDSNARITGCISTSTEAKPCCEYLAHSWIREVYEVTPASADTADDTGTDTDTDPDTDDARP